MTTSKMPDRRAAVKGLAMAAVMAVPASASTLHPDAELLALREPLERLAAEERAAAVVMVEAQDAAAQFEHDHRPQALFVQPADADDLPPDLRQRIDCFTVSRQPPRLAYGPDAASALRPKLISHDHAVANGRPSKIEHRAAERMREIVAAQEQLDATIEAAGLAREAERAEAEQYRIASELNVLIDRATSLRATTPAGFRVKAISAAACTSDTVENWIANPSEIANSASIEMASLLADIMAAEVRGW
ncbi:MAG: hypothetical protein LCH88_05315 [Proteobacteria bacterium]|nr:hypothetical protein [Pseudomonadota bacterium]